MFLSKSLFRTRDSIMKNRRTLTLGSQNFSSKKVEEYEPKPSGIHCIRFQIAKVQDLPVLQTLMEESFFKDEPIVKALGLSGKLNKEYMASHVNYAFTGHTILAIDESNDEIIAAAINNIVRPEHIQDKPKTIEEIPCPQTRKIARFWHSLYLKPDVFALFNVTEVFEIAFLVTTPAARGKGLAEKLSRESLHLAKHSGQPIAVMYCTNIASARIAQKLSMKLIGVHCISNFFQGDDLLSLIQQPDDKIYLFAISVDTIES